MVVKRDDQRFVLSISIIIICSRPVCLNQPAVRQSASDQHGLNEPSHELCHYETLPLQTTATTNLFLEPAGRLLKSLCPGALPASQTIHQLAHVTGQRHTTVSVSADPQNACIRVIIKSPRQITNGHASLEVRECTY